MYGEGMQGTVAYSASEWSIFLSAEVAASAALAGLLFVSISINLAQIVANPNLPPRAAKAVTTLVSILLGGSFCLVPGQSARVLGSELLLLGIGAWIAITVMQRVHSRGNQYVTRRQKVIHGTLSQSAAIPVVVCGGSLIWSVGGGLYWFLAAVVLSFTTALLDAWVLMIEIQR
jgi:hypothetical protein